MSDRFLAATRKGLFDFRRSSGGRWAVERASFLGERSVGHLDPGARSSQLLVQAVCTLLEEEAQ